MISEPLVLRFDKVSFSYGNVPVLLEASFHIHKGEFIALVGPNGAGKTTVLKLILALEKPTSGQITLFNETPQLFRNKIGYVPQQTDFDKAFPISVKEVVLMGRLSSKIRHYSKNDKIAVEEALSTVDIADLSNRPYSELSGGQRRRVLIARALVGKPELLILDEPTANMDADSEKRLFSTLGNLKKTTTILIVTHDMSFVSSLTDGVLCAGLHTVSQKGNTIVRHETELAPNAPENLYGGNVATILHNTEVAETCCINCKGKNL